MQTHFDAEDPNKGITLGELAHLVSRLYSVGGTDDTLIRFRSTGGPKWGTPGLHVRRVYAEIPDK